MRWGSAAAVGLALLATGCVGASRARPAALPERVVFERVCDVLVTAYRTGLRPTTVEVVVPSSRPGEPDGRLTLSGASVPPAERCLGLPDPMPVAPVAVAGLTQSVPSAPAPLPPTAAPTAAPTATSPAVPPSPPEPPRPPRPRPHDPLDSRT